MINYRILKEIMTVTEEERAILDGKNEIDHKLYMTDSSDVVNSSLMLQKGRLITIRPHTRFIDFPEHTHDFIEVVYMCSGSMMHIINGKEVLLTEGELLFLSRHAKHSIKRAEEKDVAVNFMILPEFFENSLSVLGDEDTPLKSFLTDCLCNSGGPDFLLFKVADVLPIQNLIENLIWTLLYDTKNKRSVNRTTMELLFMQLLSYTDTLEYDDKADEAIVKVLRYIEDNYVDGSLTDVAGKMHYSFSWLSKEIKRKTGMTYTELVQKKRLSQAVFYIRNTDMAINDISRLVGYDNISYFYKMFSAKYGLTPKQYRNIQKDK